jgi:hypothetical protein
MGFENGRLYRVALIARHDSDGDTQVNVLHYSQDGSGNHGQALADRFRDDVMPSFAGLYDSSWHVGPVEVTEEKDPQNPLAVRDGWISGAPLGGTKSGSGDKLPRAMCRVASLRTGHIGRRARGRIFIGGTYFESEQDDGHVAGTGNLVVNAFLDDIPRQPDIDEGIDTSTTQWVVYSRTQRVQDLDPYANSVESVLLDERYHWLRSRFS